MQTARCCCKPQPTNTPRLPAEQQQPAALLCTAQGRNCSARSLNPNMDGVPQKSPPTGGAIQVNSSHQPAMGAMLHSQLGPAVAVALTPAPAHSSAPCGLPELSLRHQGLLLPERPRVHHQTQEPETRSTQHGLSDPCPSAPPAFPSSCRGGSCSMGDKRAEAAGLPLLTNELKGNARLAQRPPFSTAPGHRPAAGHRGERSWGARRLHPPPRASGTAAHGDTEEAAASSEGQVPCAGHPALTPTAGRGSRHLGGLGY